MQLVLLLILTPTTLQKKKLTTSVHFILLILYRYKNQIIKLAKTLSKMRYIVACV